MTYFLEKISKNIVQVLFTLIIFSLMAISLISTCFISRSEHLYYTFVHGKSILFVFGALLLLYLCFLAGKDTLLPKIKIKWVVATAFILGSILVLMTQASPVADQKLCLLIAEQMGNGNFDEFQAGGYIQAYPQQIGLVLFYYVLGFLFGSHNFVAIQLVNVVAYTIFVYCNYLITKKLFSSETLAVSTAILTVAFLPLMFYTSFVYGTMLGLAASTLAMYKAMIYIEHRKAVDCILCALLAAFATLMKKNYLIVVIAILIILFLQAICRKHLRAILGMLLLVILYVGASRSTIMVAEKMTGITIGKGMPTMAWVTMGLQEGKRGYGWYNSYNVVQYRKNNRDTQNTALACKEDFHKRMEEFKQNPNYTRTFFVGKTATQWCEPTFQGFSVLRPHNTQLGNAPAYTFITEGKGNDFLYKYFDLFQSLIYIGVFFFALYNWKQTKVFDQLPIIVFLGGFLFHTFWEAKGQYVLPYFVLLFPYCMKGYSRFFYAIKRIFTKGKKTSILRTVTSLLPLFVCILICVGYLATLRLVPSIKAETNRANKVYEEYVVTEKPQKNVVNGSYRLKAFKGTDYLDVTQIEKSKGITTLLANMTNGEANAAVIGITTQPHSHLFMVEKFNLSFNSVLFKSENECKAHDYREFYRAQYNTFHWSLEKAKDDAYYICASNGLALTRNENGTVTFQVFNKKDKNQKWILEADSNSK